MSEEMRIVRISREQAETILGVPRRGGEELTKEQRGAIYNAVFELRPEDIEDDAQGASFTLRQTLRPEVEVLSVKREGLRKVTEPGDIVIELG